ncbi:MAG: hypothetical protein ACXW32_12630 [Limisphaerales bacterium]
MQQPIRKTVGRALTAEKKLAHMEDLTQFLKTHVEGAFTGVEGEYYPVRKVVGRTGAQRG